MRTTYELREAAKKVNGKARGKDRIPAGVGSPIRVLIGPVGDSIDKADPEFALLRQTDSWYSGAQRIRRRSSKDLFRN
jgi:hypothetical protein